MKAALGVQVFSKSMPTGLACMFVAAVPILKERLLRFFPFFLSFFFFCRLWRFQCQSCHRHQLHAHLGRSALCCWRGATVGFDCSAHCNVSDRECWHKWWCWGAWHWAWSFFLMAKQNVVENCMHVEFFAYESDVPVGNHCGWGWYFAQWCWNAYVGICCCRSDTGRWRSWRGDQVCLSIQVQCWTDRGESFL